MPTTTALVACAAGKVSHPAPARDLYTSALFVKARAYAEQAADSWYILSALHGLVPPDGILEPYNVTLNTMSRTERVAWGERVGGTIRATIPAGSTLLLLAGTAYRTSLLPHLGDYRIEVPLAGLGIGQQLAWLIAHTTSSRQEELPL